MFRPRHLLLSPPNDMCLYFFLRRGRLLRYLNSVIFVMTFIHNCVLACGGDIWDIKGWARTNEENQQQ